MNEYRVKVTIRNNLILSAIEALGFKTQSEFCRQNGMDSSSLNALVAMRIAPINKDGEFCAEAKLLMEILGAAPLDLWTDEQLTMRLDRNTGERVVSADAIQHLLEQRNASMTLPDPADIYEEKQRREIVGDVVKTLTEREETVLAERFVRESTYEEAGNAIGVSKERIRQIECKALRKMRDPKRANIIREFVEAA